MTKDAVANLERPPPERKVNFHAQVEEESEEEKGGQLQLLGDW